MTRSSPAEADQPRAMARGGAIHVDFLGHATVLMEIAGARVITDPFLGARIGPLQRHGPVPDAAAIHADVVLVSHGHRDHFDRASLEALPGAHDRGPARSRLAHGSRDQGTESSSSPRANR
jgi:L-ascorbate metabolism protein UlaG (beta-lactamase superfamily)